MTISFKYPAARYGAALARGPGARARARGLISSSIGLRVIPEPRRKKKQCGENGPRPQKAFAARARAHCADVRSLVYPRADVFIRNSGREPASSCVCPEWRCSRARNLVLCVRGFSCLGGFCRYVSLPARNGLQGIKRGFRSKC